MSSAFTDSLPELYDNYLAQILFESYADLLAARASTRPGRILETAAGTGIATKALQTVMGHHRHIVATDSSMPMIARGIQKTGHANVSWVCSTAERLPFCENIFDIVICQFGAMFFSDKDMAYREVQRVLKLGGIFIFSVWDDIQYNPIPEIIQNALEDIFPIDPPKFLRRVPFHYCDTELIRESLMTARLSAVHFERVSQTAIANSARDIATGFLLGTPLKAEIESRTSTNLETCIRAVTETLVNKFGSGQIQVTSAAIFVSASRF